MTKAMHEQQEKLKDAERQRAIEQIKREKAVRRQWCLSLIQHSCMARYITLRNLCVYAWLSCMYIHI
jgi:uncharacterized membrane protein (DUF106 family)